MFRKPLVSVDWLYHHLEDQNLLVLDATIPNVTATEPNDFEKKQIPGSIFFDLKETFSDQKAVFPNTMLSLKEFELNVQNLGIHKNTRLVVYDDLGIYSSARVWWMFQLMGFQNIAVLDGGLPAWTALNFPTEIPNPTHYSIGDFTALHHPEKIKSTQEVLAIISNSMVQIVDARSKGRFLGMTPEPRKEVKSGHIPSAICLPYTQLLNQGKMKSERELTAIFSELNLTNRELIFSCGTGITACIVALGAAMIGIEKYAVYDGSWTEWGSSPNLPIAK